MKPAARIIGGLMALALLCGEAAADQRYADRGVIELGGSALVNHSRRSSDFGGDAHTTRIQLQPILGYFVVRQLEVFGGLRLQWEKDGGWDSRSATGLGVLAGAGYYFAAGSVFAGPRAQVAYTRSKVILGGLDEETKNGPQLQAAGALRIPFAFGGLLDLAVVLQYERLHFNDSDEDIGDTSALRLGAELGFFVFF